MSDEEKRALIERYEMDSSIANDVTDDELDVLLQALGEMEPIVDAINVRIGASIEQRAADIGCDPEDFAYEIQGF